MKKSILKKYAHLIVKVGANVQKGQYVIVRADVDQEELVNCIVEDCYKEGAYSVRVMWGSDLLTKTAYKKASFKSLVEVPEWKLEEQRHIVKTNPAMIYIDSGDPDALKGINLAKLTKVQKTLFPIFKPFRDQRDNRYQWVIAGAPSVGWAKKVFPDLPKRKAVAKLWDAILMTSRCDDDPIKAWKEHNEDLARRSGYLNSLKLDYLHYTSKRGTDFKVWLIPNANWLAGGERTLGEGIFFNPNIPSEECFTSPMKGKAEGIVYSTKPLSYQSQLIENFSVTFKDGKATEVHAEKNEQLLREMINIDPNAGYLGEVALVPYDSPIQNSKVLFFSTLYDENAACHLALGRGFTNTIQDYDKYSKEELHNMGINDASIHVDFMIGSDDLDIVGYTKDGKAIQIFKDGNWAF